MFAVLVLATAERLHGVFICLCRLSRIICYFAFVQVRMPASYQGIFGFRPTHGRISMDQAVPLASSFDTCGWYDHSIERASRECWINVCIRSGHCTWSSTCPTQPVGVSAKDGRSDAEHPTTLQLRPCWPQFVP
jgi:hypothetical protein